MASGGDDFDREDSPSSLGPRWTMIRGGTRTAGIVSNRAECNSDGGGGGGIFVLNDVDVGPGMRVAFLMEIVGPSRQLSVVLGANTSAGSGSGMIIGLDNFNDGFRVGYMTGGANPQTLQALNYENGSADRITGVHTIEAILHPEQEDNDINFYVDSELELSYSTADLATSHRLGHGGFFGSTSGIFIDDFTVESWPPTSGVYANPSRLGLMLGL